MTVSRVEDDLRVNTLEVLTSASIPGSFINPMTTLGDTVYENATPAAARLAGNTTTTKEYLSQTGNGSISAAPAWAQVAAADLSNGVTGSGAVVLATSPALVTPALGTPASGALTNCTFPTLNQNTTGTAGGLTGTPAITVGAIICTTIAASGEATFAAGAEIESGQVLNWNDDTGLSRDSAAVIDVGNGSAGDKSGAVNLSGVHWYNGSTDTIKATIESGNLLFRNDVTGGDRWYQAFTAPEQVSYFGGANNSASALLNLVNGSILLNASGVYEWNSDTGLSRASAAVIDVGNGSAGDASGTVNAAQYNVAGSQIAASNLSNGTTGSGSVALATSPTLVTPTLGVASATSINKVAITAPATSATLTIVNGKTLTIDKSLEFDGTDSTKFTFPSSSDTVVTLGATQTLTSKTLTSPVINSTPTGTGIPTTYYLKGSGSGTDYTTASTTPVLVDVTNLSQAVTIPTGWKLMIYASGSCYVLTGAAAVEVHIFDGSTPLDSRFNSLSAVNLEFTFSLLAEINGDGASHTVALYFNTSNAARSANISNNADTTVSSYRPKMILFLTPSN